VSRFPRWVVATVVVMAALIAASWVWMRAGGSARPAGAVMIPVEGADLRRGAALYAGNCASCHGASREGAPDWRAQSPDGTFPAPPHDEAGHTWHHGDATLFAYTKFGGQALMGNSGRSGMPAFGETLSDAEIRAILAFIKSEWPPRQRAVQAERTRAENAALSRN